MCLIFVHICKNIQENLEHSVAPRIKPPVSNNLMHYHGSDSRDVQIRNQISESTNSFSSFPINHASGQQTDGHGFHHKPYPPRPPHPAPSDQFSYLQAGQQAKSRREGPPPYYSHRSHFMPNTDSGNFYNNHERMKPAPYESREHWRFNAPSFSGINLVQSHFFSDCWVFWTCWHGQFSDIFSTQVRDILTRKNLMAVVHMLAPNTSQQDSQIRDGHILLGPWITFLSGLLLKDQFQWEWEVTKNKSTLFNVYSMFFNHFVDKKFSDAFDWIVEVMLPEMLISDVLFVCCSSKHLAAKVACTIALEWLVCYHCRHLSWNVKYH